MALVGGAHALADRARHHDRRGRRHPRAGADRVVHGGGLGAMTRESWSDATARGRATGWPSPARWGRRARGSRCSTGARAPASIRRGPRAARAIRTTGAAPGGRTRAGRARRARDDRPVGRAGHRRRSPRPAQRRPDRAVAVVAPDRRGRRRGRAGSRRRPATFAATAGEDYELCACVPARSAEKLEKPRGPRSLGDLTWVGLVVEGAPGVVFVDADGELSGYEHSF